MAACGEYRGIFMAFLLVSRLLVRVWRHRSSLDHSNWMQRLALFSTVVFPDKGRGCQWGAAEWHLRSFGRLAPLLFEDVIRGMALQWGVCMCVAHEVLYVSIYLYTCVQIYTCIHDSFGHFAFGPHVYIP